MLQRYFTLEFKHINGAKAIADLYYNDYNTMKIGAEAWTRDAKTRSGSNDFPSDTTFIGELPTPNAKCLMQEYLHSTNGLYHLKYFTINSSVRLDYIRTANDTAYVEVFRYKIKDGKHVLNFLVISAGFILSEVSNEFSLCSTPRFRIYSIVS
jgi:hypothetical protein